MRAGEDYDADAGLLHVHHIAFARDMYTIGVYWRARVHIMLQIVSEIE